VKITEKDKKWLNDLADTFEQHMYESKTEIFIISTEMGKDIIERLRKITEEYGY